MSARSIIWVPGQKPKPPPKLYREQLWRCLTKGVADIAPEVAEDLRQNPEAFGLSAWNLLYYRTYRDINQDIPWVNALLKKHTANARDVTEATTWGRHLTWVLYHLFDSMHWAINWIPDPDIKAAMTESDRYFENHDGVADRVRRLLKEDLRQALDLGRKVMLIGHSLGSVIAYDTLWELSHEDGYAPKIDALLTLGSPLGVKFVQKRLKGAREQGIKRYPHNIHRWFNIAAMGELRAIDRILRKDFSPMLEMGLVESIEDCAYGVFNYYRDENGLNVHRSYGYLVNSVTAGIISDWWAGRVDPAGPSKARRSTAKC